MADLTLRGIPVKSIGQLPGNGTSAPDFNLVATDLSEVKLGDFSGSRLLMNIFPSIDTSTCAASVRRFNELASNIENTKVFCISRDLPFAQKRFCGAEGLENVISLSDFKTGAFGKNYGVELLDSKLAGLHARAILVVDVDGKVIHSHLVSEIADEPNYDAAFAALK